MKRITAFVLCLVLCFLISGCKEPENAQTGAGIINPLSEISTDDMAKELGLKSIKTDGITDSHKINGNSIIYSLDAEKDDTVYNIRLSKANEPDETDISGVYLSDNCVCTIYDSANIDEAPSLTVESDSKYSKAYGYWNGYRFSVSANKKLSPDKMYKIALDYIKKLICKENLSAENTDTDNKETGFDEKFLSYIENNINGNYMVSPLSFRYALGMLLSGAEGNTKAQLLKALNVSSVDEWTNYCKKFNNFTEQFYNKLNSQIKSHNEYVKKGYIGKDVPAPFRALKVANSVWKREDIKENFKAEYSDYIKENYNAEYLDFTEKNVIKKVNGWVNEKTEKMIPRLLPDNYDTTDLAVILMNALYYKNSWDRPFDKFSTKDADFHKKNGKTVKKKFMEQTESFDYYQDNDTQMVILPMNSGVNMAFVLGDNSNIRKKIAKSESRRVAVKIPKMDIETSLNNKELMKFLEENGVSDAFDNKKADFSKMINHKIWVDDIIQKTKIKTDEDGVEAAAVTAIATKDEACIIDNNPIKFVADKPFSFYIYAACDDVNAILFAGKVVE